MHRRLCIPVDVLNERVPAHSSDLRANNNAGRETGSGERATAEGLHISIWAAAAPKSQLLSENHSNDSIQKHEYGNV